MLLFAKRRKDKTSSNSKQRKKNATKKTNNNNASSSSSSITSSPEIKQLSNKATIRPPASLAGIVEDHRHEQFFYDDITSHQLYNLVDMYDYPLLLCNPTLAVMAEKKKRPYKLLDRDRRFDFLSGYEYFSLTEPHLVTGYDFDVVFIDPPFANVTPEEVAQCLRLMAADKVPLWIAYNSKREEKLLEVMNSDVDLEDGGGSRPELVPKWRLSYKEGVGGDMQDSIWLYGPKWMHEIWMLYYLGCVER